MFMLLSEQAHGRATWSVQATDARRHHTGDPWFSTLPANVGQPSALLSCISVTLQATDK